MKEYKNLTRKEIEIIFGYLFCVKKFVNYVSGYRNYYQEYDVVEGDNKITIYYANKYHDLPVCTSYIREEYKTC